MSLHPTVSAEDDARIRQVLEEAKELHASLEPLYTWDELVELIGSCNLAVLSRQPAFESLYASTFNPLVKSVYGKMEIYLRKQLGWTAGAEEEGKEYWERGARTNVRRNDWPYGVPRDVSHWVVWVPLPLFHPALCTPSATPRSLTPLPPFLSTTSSSASPLPSPSASGTSTPSGPSSTNPLALPHAHGTAAVAPTKGTWDWVSRNGLSGLTGRAEGRWRDIKLRRSLSGSGDPGEGEGEQGGGEGAEQEYEETDGPEREIAAFVRGRWRAEEGWETAWFANPPSLQSVPGLAHFHVLARKTGGEGESEA
ncbi:hypothetical protein JCM6882_002693 [Rhodosporidiobolus microsporus]